MWVLQGRTQGAYPGLGVVGRAAPPRGHLGTHTPPAQSPWSAGHHTTMSLHAQGGGGGGRGPFLQGTCPRRCTGLFHLTHWPDRRQMGTAGLILGAICSAQDKRFYSGEKGAVSTGGGGRSRPQGGVGPQSCHKGHMAMAVHLGLHGLRDVGAGGQARHWRLRWGWRSLEKLGHPGRWPRGFRWA